MGSTLPPACRIEAQAVRCALVLLGGLALLGAAERGAAAGLTGWSGPASTDRSSAGRATTGIEGRAGADFLRRRGGRDIAPRRSRCRPRRGRPGRLTRLVSCGPGHGPSSTRSCSTSSPRTARSSAVSSSRDAVRRPSRPARDAGRAGQPRRRLDDRDRFQAGRHDRGWRGRDALGDVDRRRRHVALGLPRACRRRVSDPGRRFDALHGSG